MSYKKLENWQALERNHNNNFKINCPAVAYLNKFSNTLNPESSIQL